MQAMREQTEYKEQEYCAEESKVQPQVTESGKDIKRDRYRDELTKRIRN
jgi:hypothetical protein